MKRPGRPRLALDDDSVPLSVRLTAKQYEATQKQAAADRMTMAEWVRQMLARGNSVFKNRPG
jgi:hypothetical protein